MPVESTGSNSEFLVDQTIRFVCSSLGEAKAEQHPPTTRRLREIIETQRGNFPA